MELYKLSDYLLQEIIRKRSIKSAFICVHLRFVFVDGCIGFLWSAGTVSIYAAC